MLKKLLLAAAVAATVSTGAQAVGVSSNVTGAQLFSSFNDVLSTGGVTSPFTIGGDTVTGLTFGGQGVFNVGQDIRITFDLFDGVRQGVNGAGGTIFNGGTINIETDTGYGFSPYNTIDAADPSSTIDFLAGGDGHLQPVPTQTKSGLVVDDAGNGTLGGLWDGQFNGTGFNNETATINLLGNSFGLYLEGSVSVVA
jgi:hypothetical protein